MKFYTGVGSRETPIEICELMIKIGIKLEKKGYILRSGGAPKKKIHQNRTDIDSADLMFEKYVKNKVIYTVKNFDFSESNYLMCFDELSSIFNEKEKIDNYTKYCQTLLLRNMNQVLGSRKTTLKTSDFLICWTKTEDYSTSKAGGTRFAVRCALKHEIPVFNLVNKEHRERIEKWLKE